MALLFGSNQEGANSRSGKVVAIVDGDTTGHTSRRLLKAYAKLRPNSLAAWLNGKKRG